jgi:hypothetical protein
MTSANVLAGLYALPAGFNNGGGSPALTFAAGKTAAVGALGWIGRIDKGKLTAPYGADGVAPGS